MRKSAIFVLLFSVSLWAADFWQSKKYSDWSDKDVQKMIDNSPWSRPVTVSDDVVPPGGSSGKHGRGGMGEIGGDLNTDPTADAPRSGVGDRARGAEPDRGTAPLVTFVVRWESALPMREARVRAKYGSEAETSADAKKIIDTEEPTYVITVSGLRANALRGDPETVRKQMLADASLTVKGKGPIKPVDFRLQRGNSAAIAMFAFPKSAPLSLEDKEVEFSAKFDSLPVRQRFQFKNMTIAGKLEL